MGKNTVRENDIDVTINTLVPWNKRGDEITHWVYRYVHDGGVKRKWVIRKNNAYFVSSLPYVMVDRIEFPTLESAHAALSLIYG